MKVKIKEWNAVTSWIWSLDTDRCTICQLAFEQPCPRCKLPGDECPPVTGACNHHFHLHCIVRWTEEQDYCPLDRQKWKVKN
ncbi:unnamed protein product (macronuclear) [Paramecium tetraurelia]|uniref:Anaphase-promoting complex subunit 11 n=1 Tax=Paramecium tetraurelia TaxID=5888 RepID=A0C6P3_PARTE|nr:uncharacterized protein GSPATT00035589001 [Paramecium tetraurelia]CAK66460.1 unnamed protein product [Paramecium tetraurelia]|eukprot:XP_001433857.1 hypothetical protein (macronuclear) [Paramecium tetraurelia strain d4-2]